MYGVKWEEDRYNAFVNLIDQGFFAIDVIFDENNEPIDMYYVEANEAATKMLGFDFTGKRLRDIDPHYEAYWYKIFGNVALTGQSVRMEQYAEPDKRWYSFYIFKIGDEKSRRIGNIFLDITERKKTEEALEESEQLYRTLFENTEDGFVLVQPILDESGYSDNYLMVDVNQAWEKQTGLKAVDLKGKTVRECLPEVESIWPLTFADVLKSGISAHFESFNLDSNRWYDLYAFNYKKDQVGVLFRDITERKKIEEALRKSEDRQAFLLKLSDAIRPLSEAKTIQDTATCLLSKHLGASQVNYSEYHEDAGIAKIQRENINDPQTSMKGIYKLNDYSSSVAMLSSGRDLVISDVPAFTEFPIEERERWTALNIRASIIIPLIKDGKLVVTLAVRNTTQRKWTPEEVELVREIAERTWTAVERTKAEDALRESENRARELVKELEQADKNKNAFLNMLSHELRNPLATINAGIQLLEITNEKNQTDKAKNIMKNQMEHLCRLVDDLLDLTRISNNKIELKKEKIELNKIASQAIEPFKPLFDQKGIILRTDFRAELLFLDADPVRLAQIIGNLLHNALKFTDKDGKVDISVYKENNQAVIRVADTGIGIQPELLSELFVPFVQADHSLAHTAGGLGLGLSIVKGIAELHGGTVSAYSEGLGKGSSFCIYLLLLKAEERKLDNMQVHTKTCRPLKILVIEDNRDFADLVCTVLQILGHHAETALNGREGIEKAKALSPDVIFCDIGLPVMDGFEVAKRIRGVASIQNAYLIALSGYASHQDAEQAFKSGFNKHLAKPVDIAIIENVLNQI